LRRCTERAGELECLLPRRRLAWQHAEGLPVIVLLAAGRPDGKGDEIPNPDRAAFGTRLAGARFYKDWKGTFKPEIWAALEQSKGPLL
jgi:hypothetical protein